MATDPTPTTTTPPVNPAQGILGNIPAGGAAANSYYTGVPEGYIPISGLKPKATKDSTGKESRVFYNPNLDANVILNSLSPDSRNRILKGLAEKGLYGNSEPGNGYQDKDKTAFADLLVHANVTGLPFGEAYLDFMQRAPTVQASKKAPSIRVTSEDDVKVVIRKASSDLLGYEISDDVAKNLAKGYRQLELQEAQRQQAGGVFESAASPSVFAEKQILKQFKPEAQSFAAGNLAQLMDDAIKRLGS